MQGAWSNAPASVQAGRADKVLGSHADLRHTLVIDSAQDGTFARRKAELDEREKALEQRELALDEKSVRLESLDTAADERQRGRVPHTAIVERTASKSAAPST